MSQPSLKEKENSATSSSTIGANREHSSGLMREKVRTVSQAKRISRYRASASSTRSDHNEALFLLRKKTCVPSAFVAGLSTSMPLPFSSVSSRTKKDSPRTGSTIHAVSCDTARPISHASMSSRSPCWGTPQKSKGSLSANHAHLSATVESGTAYVLSSVLSRSDRVFDTPSAPLESTYLPD